MTGQGEFQRIMEGVISPINRHWGGEFDSETIADFVDDLSGYDADTLRKAMADLRREQKRRPTIAHVHEACKRYGRKELPPEQKPNEESFHCVEHVEHVRPWIAKEILDTLTGQKALKLGVASDMLVAYECSGRKEFDDAFVEKSKKALGDLMRALVECRKIKNPFTETWESLYHAMREREKRLYSKYYHQKMLEILP